MISKNKSLILIGSIILVAAIVMINRKHKEVHADVSDVPMEVAPTQPPEKLIDQAKESKGLATANLSEEEKNSDCRATIESIETLPFKTLMYDLENGKLKINSKCTSLAKEKLTLLKGFPEVCEQLKDGKPTDDCMQKLFFYKALRIQRATANENLDGLPTDVIINKLIGLIAEEAFTNPEGVKAFREVGKKIYERLPESESAAKAALTGYLADDHLSEQDQKDADKMVEEARQKFPESWEVFEIDLIRKQARDEDEFKDAVGQYYASNPASPIGIYYMGCVQWAAGQAIPARNYFKSASERAPGEQRFQETYQNAMKTNPPTKVCTVQIGFDPNKF